MSSLKSIGGKSNPRYQGFKLKIQFVLILKAELHGQRVLSLSLSHCKVL